MMKWHMLVGRRGAKRRHVARTLGREAGRLLGASALALVLVLEVLGDPALLEVARRLCGSN